MKLHWNKGNILFLGIIGVALLALFISIFLWPTPHSQAPDLQVPATPTSNAIVNENAHQGTRSWQIPNGEAASTQIRAYANATSVSPGQSLTFYVSTQQEGTLYAIDIYRLGWYGGLGARLMAYQLNQIGHAQGYYDPSIRQLVGCQSCRIDTQTGRVEANWQPSYTFTVPSDWTTGVYLAKFTDANNMQTYTPFDVRGNAHSTYVAVTSDTTYEAYNNWGGYSLYAFNSLHTKSLGMGVKVSFDRPYEQGVGSGYVLQFEADSIHWLERQGYDLSYISSVDLHEDSAQLVQHRAYLSLGHDEYWSKEMRNGVEYARDQGVGLAFLGANAAYWQIRFEPDSAGIPDRTIVCYKVETQYHDLARDPLYGKDNTRVTTQWRDPVLNRPENALVGIMFSSLIDTTKQTSFPWEVDPSANSALLDGTGLQPGQQYGCDLVGYEWDRIFNNGDSPPGLQVLATSHTVSENNRADTSNTTYYIAPSGAMVFATGSIYWTYSLDNYRSFTDNTCAGQTLVITGMQKLMANVMNALAVKHPFNS